MTQLWCKNPSWKCVCTCLTPACVQLQASGKPQNTGSETLALQRLFILTGHTELASTVDFLYLISNKNKLKQHNNFIKHAEWRQMFLLLCFPQKLIGTLRATPALARLHQTRRITTLLSRLSANGNSLQKQTVQSKISIDTMQGYKRHVIYKITEEK